MVLFPFFWDHGTRSVCQSIYLPNNLEHNAFVANQVHQSTREAADSNLTSVSSFLGVVKTSAGSLSSTKQSNELTRKVTSDCIEIILLPCVYSVLATRCQRVNANMCTLPGFAIHPTPLNSHIFVPYPCPSFFHPHLQSLSLLQSILLARPMLSIALLTCTMQRSCCHSVCMPPEKVGDNLLK